jgi:hypothetical protein
LRQRDIEVQLWTPRSAASPSAPLPGCPWTRHTSLQNPRLAAAALHQIGRPGLNRNFGAAIMPVRIRLHRALKELKADGTIDRFAAKYFDVKVVLK